MAYDGTLKFDTGIDTSGFQKGILTLANTAKTGLKAAVTAIAGGTTAVAGIGAAAIKAGADFEAQMSRVKAISGATGAELEKLKDQAIQLGADTSFSASGSGYPTWSGYFLFCIGSRRRNGKSGCSRF